MGQVMLKVEGLSKNYGGKAALQELNLEINRGDLYGLIGPNGAGKTTFFKIIATVMKASAGQVWLGGVPLLGQAQLRRVRSKLGYMPDSFGVYEAMTVAEYLSFFAAAYDIANPKRRQLVDDVLALVDLDVKKDALVDSLSRGMQQRLGLARVLIHDPELLILDEPASGLDPRARVEIRSLLAELQKMGKTILISSHILADLGEICNRIGIIEQGKLLVDGTLADVLASVKSSPIVYLRVADRADEAMQSLKELPFVQRVYTEGESIVLEVVDNFEDMWQIARTLTEKGFKLNYLQQEAKSLEHAFMQLTAGKVS